MSASTAFVALALTLCACAASPGSYALGEGDANYDAVRSATQTCEARGGEIRLKNDYDGRELSSYECKIGRPR